MNKQKLAELSLLYGIPILMNATENSRLAGLQRKVQKVAIAELRKLPKFGKEEIAFIDNNIETYFKRVGWWKNPTYIDTLISFCMDVLDESPYKYNPKIKSILNDIAVHLDSHGEFIKPTMEERDTLLDNWKLVYK